MWNYTKGNADMFKGAPDWATVAFGYPGHDTLGWAEKWEKGARWSSQSSLGHYHDHGYVLYGNMTFYRVIGQRVAVADIDDDALFQPGLKLVVINNTNEIHHYFDIGDEVALKRVLSNGDIVCCAMKRGVIMEQIMKKHQVVLANPDLTPCQQFGWKVGDTFRVKSANGHFNVNSIVKLSDDGGSWRPAFVGSGICRYMSIEHVERVERVVANVEPIKTPAQERGIKVGTSVIVIDPYYEGELGSVATLVEDDGTTTPYFDVVYPSGYQKERIGLHLNNVSLINNKVLGAVTRANMAIKAVEFAKQQKEAALAELEAIVAE